ncbi:MAG: hypothetical protein ACRD7E_01630, partial [Bryobacteraceae bacterium]
MKTVLTRRATVEQPWKESVLLMSCPIFGRGVRWDNVTGPARQVVGTNGSWADFPPFPRMVIWP